MKNSSLLIILLVMVVEVYVYYSLKRKIEVANLLCNCIAHLLCAAYC